MSDQNVTFDGEPAEQDTVVAECTVPEDRSPNLPPVKGDHEGGGDESD